MNALDALLFAAAALRINALSRGFSSLLDRQLL